jgi:hypothetical protein
VALAERALIVRFLFAIGFLALTGTSVWAQTPASTQSSEPPRWQVEIYGGPMLASRSGDGLALSAPDPERFTAFNGRPSASVPSWYYGYGALMVGAVNTALLAGPGITPLDEALRQPMMQRTHGWQVGARLMRTLNPRWSLEFAGSYTTNGAEILDEARQRIEVTRDSFTLAWLSFLRAGGHSVESVTSVAEFQSASLRQMLSTGSLLFQLRPGHRVRPYLTFGGGVLWTFGDLPKATLTGRYRFQMDGIGPIDETDRLVVNLTMNRHAPVVIAGTGVDYDLSPSWGIRADLRAHMMHNSVIHLIDADPASVQPPAGTGRGVTAPDTYLTVQHSTLDGVRSSLSASTVDLKMFDGRGGVASVGLTAGVFWRF